MKIVVKASCGTMKNFESNVKVINYVVRIVVSTVISFLCIALLAFQVNDSLKDLWIFLLSLSLSNVLNTSLKTKNKLNQLSPPGLSAFDLDEVDGPLLRSKDGKQKGKQLDK